MIRKTSVVHWGSLLLVAGLMFFLRLDSESLTDNEETRFALQARQMIQTGDWIVPRWNFRPLGTKPPLYTWSIAVVSKAAGRVDEWTARLPSAAAATGTLLLIYGLGVRLFGRRAALLASLVLATSYLFWDGARFARTDMYLTFFVTLSLVCLVAGAGSGRWAAAGWLMGAFAAAAGGVLSKGPVGFALPALVGFLYLTHRRRWTVFPVWGYGAGALVFIGVAVPWYVLYGQTAGSEYLWEMLFRQNITRYVSAFDHENPVYYYVGYFPPNFLPWMGAMLPALAYGASRAWRDGTPGTWVFLWWAAVFVFFSLSTSKRPSYMLPMFPPAALLTGYYLDAEVFLRRGSRPTGWGRIGLWLLGVTFLGFLAVGVGLPVWAGFEEPHLLRSMIWVGIFLLAASALALGALCRKRVVSAFAIFLGGIVLVQGVAQWSLIPAIDDRRSPAEAARRIARAAKGAHLVAFLFDKGSLAFYGRTEENGYADGKGEVYFLRDREELEYFLDDYLGPTYVVMRSKVYRTLPDELRSKMRVVWGDLPYGKYRMTLVTQREPRGQPGHPPQ